jgi:hypothetical protein
MCFCHQASFTAGAILLGLGIVTVFLTLCRVNCSLPIRKRLFYVPLAIISIIFGTQQICEGFVWLNTNNVTAVRIFSFFAFAFWSFWIPVAFLAVEWIHFSSGQSRKIRYGWILLNVIIGFFMLIFVSLHLPHHATILGKHIVYGDSMTAAYAINPSSWNAADGVTIGVYVYLIISTMILTSARGGKWLGLISAITFIIAVAVFQQAWTSVWCFFEAIVSLFILYIVYIETK